MFQNDLIQLIQYAPTTEEVYERPLLVVPPWINKYYILDLVPEKSFVKWAVEQGFTVFLVSWVNPDARLAQKTFEDYMREGILAAVDAVIRQTGSRQINALGYCVGGTLLASTLAYMAAKGDDRIASASFLAAQVDFSEAGDLLVFIDDAQLKSLEEMMAEQGYLDGSRMAAVFNMLRPRDLIWPYVVNNYLLGKKPFPFDLLFWNADSTRLPAANHAFYLREFYHLNRLEPRARCSSAGCVSISSKVKIPIYELFTKEDHIAPASLGVPRQQAVRRTGAPRHGGVGPYRRRGQSAGQEEISVLVGRHAAARSTSGWPSATESARIVVARLGDVARRLFGRQDPGARSGVGTAASRSRTRRAPIVKSPRLAQELSSLRMRNPSAGKACGRRSVCPRRL